eukprot:5008549-Prymnesium_polylepis.2
MTAASRPSASSPRRRCCCAGSTATSPPLARPTRARSSCRRATKWPTSRAISPTRSPSLWCCTR